MKNPDFFLKDDVDSKIRNKYFFGFIEGDFGDGKTLGLTWIGYCFKQIYYKIFANYPIEIDGKSEHLTEINKDILFDLNNSKHRKCLLLLQEAYHYYDKRYCMKKENKEIMEATFQIRKMNVDTIGDIVRHKYLDKRCIDVGKFYMTALANYQNNPNVFEYGIKKFMGYRYGLPQFIMTSRFNINALPLYELYDTYYMTK